MNKIYFIADKYCMIKMRTQAPLYGYERRDRPAILSMSSFILFSVTHKNDKPFPPRRFW